MKTIWQASFLKSHKLAKSCTLCCLIVITCLLLGLWYWINLPCWSIRTAFCFQKCPPLLLLGPIFSHATFLRHYFDGVLSGVFTVVIIMTIFFQNVLKLLLIGPCAQKSRKVKLLWRNRGSKKLLLQDPLEHIVFVQYWWFAGGYLPFNTDSSLMTELSSSLGVDNGFKCSFSIIWDESFVTWTMGDLHSSVIFPTLSMIYRYQCTSTKVVICDLGVLRKCFLAIGPSPKFNTVRSREVGSCGFHINLFQTERLIWIHTSRVLLFSETCALARRSFWHIPF